jgi:hypothetical protein
MCAGHSQRADGFERKAILQKAAASFSEKWTVFGKLDSESLKDYNGKVGLGSELAVSSSQIREHK